MQAKRPQDILDMKIERPTAARQTREIRAWKDVIYGLFATKCMEEKVNDNEGLNSGQGCREG